MAEEEVKKSNPLLVYGVALIFLILIIAGLIVFRIFNPNFSITSILIWSLVFATILGSISGAFHWYYYRKEKKEDIRYTEELELPPAISRKEAEKRALEIYEESYYQYLDEAKDVGPGHFGKSGKVQVFTMTGKGSFDGKTYAIIMNQHYPDITKIIEISSTSDGKINLWQNRIAIAPEDEPTRHKTIIYDPLTGRETTTETREPSRKIAKKKKKEEDTDL